MEKLRWPRNNGSDEYLFCVVHINNRALTTSSFFLFALGIRNLRSNKILYVPWKTGIASSFSFSFLKVSDMFVYKKEKMREELLLLIAIVCLLASIVERWVMTAVNGTSEKAIFSVRAAFFIGNIFSEYNWSDVSLVERKLNAFLSTDRFG